MVTVKLPVLEPPGIVILAGTDAEAPLEASKTPNPADGAEPESVIVPELALPPTTLVGLSETD